MIAGDRFSRSTLVWNTTMSDWASASKTELVNLFGDAPPPLPASALPSWPVYALATLPLWGGLLVAVLSQSSADSYNMTPFALFKSPWWMIFYFAGFYGLGATDAISLRRAGLDVRWALVSLLICVPAYLVVRGVKLRKTYDIGHLRAYAPLYVLIAMLAASVLIAPVYFGLDAMGIDNG